LAERSSLAEELGCDTLEIPADLIKNPTEEDLTGQPIGGVPSNDSVSKLYRHGLYGTKLILHTDPGILRHDHNGKIVIPKLRWGDPEWCDRYGKSVGKMVANLEGEVVGVEVHPGNEEGSLEDLARGIVDFSHGVRSVAGKQPLFLIENKYRQRVERIETMIELIDRLPHNEHFDLVIDVMNLWKTYRSRMPEAISSIPWVHVRALHLHFSHRAPSNDDPVGWPAIFEEVRGQPRSMFLNPEVFHTSELEKALSFIKGCVENEGPL
jgi:sugar phosphate isomerase/epimerase